MTDTNTVIDNAFAQSPASTDAPAIVDNKAAEDVAVNDAPDADAPEQEVDTPFPKKAINALSRKDKQLGKLRYQTQQYEARIREMEAKLAALPAQVKPAPQESDYGNYGEYLKAIAKHEAKQEFETSSKAEQENRQKTQAEQQRAFQMQQREEQVVQQSRAYIEANPEAAALIQQNANVIDTWSPEVQMVFLQAENAPLAFHVLAKEGLLEDLADMTPYQAAMAIGRAEARGASMAKTKQVTKAPQPMASAKGTGSASRGLAQMSAKELLKEMND